MKEKINVFDHAEIIEKALRKGILLNSNGEKFNSMVIGWGHLGIIWGMETFTVYVRGSRYTKKQLDLTGEFTLSVPLNEERDPKIFEVCGQMSDHDIDKTDYVTLEDPDTNHTPGIREFPLTIECEVLYQNDIPDHLRKDILDRYYSRESDKDDYHTMYIGKIVDAYIIK